MNSLIQRLRDLKGQVAELLTTGADGVEKAADLMREIEVTARMIAVKLRSAAEVSSADSDKVELQSMLTELEAPAAKADNPFQGIFKQILAALITELLKKYPL